MMLLVLNGRSSYQKRHHRAQKVSGSSRLVAENSCGMAISMRAGKATARQRMSPRSDFQGNVDQVRQPRVTAAREQGVKSRAVDKSAKGSDCSDCAKDRKAAASGITAKRLAAIHPARRNFAPPNFASPNSRASEPEVSCVLVSGLDCTFISGRSIGRLVRQRRGRGKERGLRNAYKDSTGQPSSAANP